MDRSAADPRTRVVPAVDRRAYLPSLLLFAALAAGLQLSAGVIARSYSHDMMFLSDMIWRTALGEVPHLDYETPVGIAFIWPYRIVGAFSGGTIADVLRANILVGAFLLALCFAVLPRRLPPALLFLAVATILATAMTGRTVDAGIADYDFLAPYNRWGWAFAMLAAFIVGLPADGIARRRGVADGIVLGLVLAILYYLKISVFAAALGMTFLALILRLLGGRTALVALACAALVAAGVELIWGSNAAYLHDLARAARINTTEGRGLFRVDRLLFSLILLIVFGWLSSRILRLHARGAGRMGTLRLWWRESLMLVGIVGAAAAIRVQNHPSFELTMFGAALLVAAEHGRRRFPTLLGPAPPEDVEKAGLKLRRAALGGILAIGAAFIPAMDAASVAAHALETNLAAHCRAPVFAGTPLERLLFPRKDAFSAPFAGDRCSDVLRRPFGTEPLYTTLAQDRRLLRTAGLLRGLVRPGDVVLALDFSNPYPSIFRTPPPRGALAWMDQGRTFSLAIHPGVDALLDQADLVVQTDYRLDPIREVPGAINDFFKRFRPKLPDLLGPGQDAWLVYGRAVEARFTPVARSGEVRIWRRRGARR